MAILEIVQIGHPALRKAAKEVSIDEILSPAIQELVDNMIETMQNAPGVGLAGPQVDRNIRLFVAEAHPSKRRPNIGHLELIAIFNPEITVIEKAWDSDWEGCLSIDHGAMQGIVKRYSKIRIEGLDRNAQPIIRELDGFHARIAQHETDHLEGVLFFDRIYERRENREDIVIATKENIERYFTPGEQKSSSAPEPEESDTEI